jgi:hypothetical protein
LHIIGFLCLHTYSLTNWRLGMNRNVLTAVWSLRNSYFIVYSTRLKNTRHADVDYYYYYYFLFFIKQLCGRTKRRGAIKKNVLQRERKNKSQCKSALTTTDLTPVCSEKRKPFLCNLHIIMCFSVDGV